MPIELGIWRIDAGVQQVSLSSLDAEKRLEDILHQDIGIASPNWMIVGRQVETAYNTYIDLLGIDRDGRLIVLELKRGETPREIVAQLLDYCSWIRTLDNDDVAAIFAAYRAKYFPKEATLSLDDAFCRAFNVPAMPEELNSEHELVVVASALDNSTERIVTYLAEQYGVSINAIFFRAMNDGDREYLTRVWFRDPTELSIQTSESTAKGEWNGEFYASFGEGPSRRWADAVKYGFISAGGGSWYSGTLSQLEAGCHVWVNVPNQGYVGVGTVLGPVVKVDAFTVKTDSGMKPITELPVDAPEMFANKDDLEKAEYLVPVRWEKTVALAQAIKETGFFGNQNSVCKPRCKKWEFTISRLKQRFGVECSR